MKFILSLLVLAGAVLTPAAAGGPPAGAGNYQDMVGVFEEFLAYKAPSAWNANFNSPDAPDHGLIDYSKPAIEKRERDLAELRVRLDDMNVAAWPIEQQAEYLAIRSEFDAQSFRLKVSRPWARDPGFYADQLLRFTFTDLPVEGDKKEVLKRQLAAVPMIVAAAKQNLDDVATDYAKLAIHNLTTSDGVGHGHPYRATPPAGVIGWYDDFLARARDAQPDMVSAIEAARDAAVDYHDWLNANMSSFTSAAGVGDARYDWYLKHAKLLPYTGDELILLGDQEWDRLYSFYTLARHRNRNLAELKPATSAKEYKKRIAGVDKNIRKFLKREEIITIPPYVGELDTNAPFIERPGGLNFWEAVQFRDPHPDHLHAVIPGHRFDGLVEDNNSHPVRGRISNGVRAEGWGVYLEEAMMQAGLLEDYPRVDELIYLFGIFRAARVPADVATQRNDMTVQQAVDFMRGKTPWLDENVARVDAEIYLRRPPGYGVGYTIGALQMRNLLADHSNQLGDEFNLKEFHDAFMAAGRLPIALIRWQMTGLDDEVQEFWNVDPMPE
ncbi:DUF885 family protein [Hyphococcus sp.]|uniref:DUF885 family protein n=1 Tax=Hyphococcus sp. TaxID=2038636 RepID=UPI002089F045|nr:MAG: hypothetical protein DHS20C04_17170 [Marinicaulis sp.]